MQTGIKKACKRGSTLPPGADENNQFHGVFIPTYEWWAGTQANPWIIPDKVTVPVLQTIWDTIYPDIPWTVNVNNCVFEHVCFFFQGVTQCLCEWCSSFKSAANIMFEQFFKEFPEDIKSYDSPQTWAGKMLVEYKFVWAMVDEWVGLMCSPNILQVFATHLNSIVGAEDVSSLEATGVNWDVSAIVKYPQMPLYRLMGFADSLRVEQTLRLWAGIEINTLDLEHVNFKKPTNKVTRATSKLNPATGVISNAASKFSAENWGKATQYYFVSIDKMKSGSVEEIVQLATPFMSPLKSCHQESLYGPCGLAQAR
ncbi:hypothetical protein EDB83DRAFT_2236891 [Lactarius deliciosus]|nr:hypothetical protein EDB83DRAFT_2236891 [Lactarius deliciosus]